MFGCMAWFHGLDGLDGLDGLVCMDGWLDWAGWIGLGSVGLGFLNQYDLYLDILYVMVVWYCLQYLSYAVYFSLGLWFIVCLFVCFSFFLSVGDWCVVGVVGVGVVGLVDVVGLVGCGLWKSMDGV